MIKVKTGIISLLIMVLFVSGINAQMLFLTDDTIQINEVVVTGTPLKVNRNNVPMAVSVVGREQIEGSNESALLPVLNGRVPGLFVTERGITGFGVAAGSAGQISIRGIGGNPTTGVLILIDGHPQFMGIMGHPLPDSYVSSDVERVEVIRGPASVLYGSNAMGGVINIITRKLDRKGFHGNAGISYGSFNTIKYGVAAGIKKEKLSVFHSFNHDQTDGHRPNSDFKISNGYVKIDYNINEHFYASADLSMAGFKATDPGPDTIKAKPGQQIDISRGYGSFSLQNEFEKFSGALKLFYNFGEHDITDGFHSTDNNYGINLYETLKLFQGNMITAGLDWITYGGLAENLKAMNGKGVVFADTSLHETGIYAFMQQSLAEKITLNAGIRYQNNSVYGSHWIPSAGFAFQINKTTTWKGNFSKGFRSPTIRELYMWGQKNPKLEPETVKSFESGLIKSFLNHKLNGEITLYSIKGDNMIVDVPLKGFQNTGSISNKGIEVALDAELLKNLTMNATYSFVKMENPVFATPEQHLFAGLSYKINKLELAGNIQQIIDLDNDPSPKINQVDYFLLNMKASYRITRWMKAYVSGENLLNQNYQVNRYYTMPGTTIFGGLSFVF